MIGAGKGFTIAAKIRETAEASLYRGFRTSDMRPVLLKSPHPGRLTTTELARLRHEHAILSAIGEATDERALGIEDLGQLVALVMDYPGDLSLDGLVNQAPMDLGGFLRTAVAMAEAVEVVHRHHIIHRDIKPENFFRDRASGKVTLINFGAATRLALEDGVEDQPDVHVGRLAGTLAYMSPEQTGRMNRSVDRRTDLYSLGVALYELGTGALPFPTSDPLELLHSHIARAPVPPHVARSDWPRVLSEIVMRLLAKNAEDRYQDVAGLKADLMECQRRLADAGAVETFPLGAHDFCDELRIPQKLYGREPELATLLETFARTCKGSAELLLVSGNSGVGKSVLVGELQKQLATGAQLATGKFDPIGRRIPYAPIVQACGGMLRSILAEPPTALAHWRQRLSQAVGNNGRLLTDIIPELSLVWGPQPPVEALDPAQSQHRFEATFLAFLQVFAFADHPLALFLDDLQWADSASLRMIRLLLTAPQRGYLLVIGAYRDNEVDPTHPLAGTLADLRRAGTTLTQIELHPLNASAIEQLLGDTFVATPLSVRPLAKLALRKTEGNPFFLGQFLTTLYGDGHIKLDPSTGQWVFELRKIEKTTATDNVVDFMAGRLQRLPPGTQDVLRLAACLGSRFDLRGVALAAERDPAQVRELLWPALREGLVVALDGDQGPLHEASDRDAPPGYRFLHDRVQQAVYGSMAKDQRQRVHLRIGRMQLATGDATISDRQLFEIVNHLDLGAELIDTASERRSLARLNFSAASKAKDAAAHATAIRHLDICMDLLGPSAWQDDYDTALQAAVCRIECDIATGQLESACRVLDGAEAAVRDDFDRVTLQALRTLVLVSSNRMGEAIASGVAAANILGMEFPSAPQAIGQAIGAELGAIFGALGARGATGLLDLPAMADRKSLLLLHVLHRIMPAAAQVDPALMTLIVARAVHLSLQQGNAPVSAYFCACLAHVQVVMGDALKGYEIGQIAVRLNQAIGGQSVACAVHFLLGAFVAFWTRGVSESVDHLRQGRSAALEAGDYLYACYCAMGEAVFAFQTGEALEDVAEVAGQAADLIERTGDVTNHDVVTSLRRTVHRLQASSGPCPGPDHAEAERKIVEGRNPFVISCHFQFVALEKYLDGDCAGASVYLARAKPGVPGNFNQPQSEFLAALLLAEQVRAGGETAPAALAELESAEATFRGWTATSPETFGYRHALVAAELASARDDVGQALTLFELAIKLAQDAGQVLYEALANELAGKHAERRGWLRMAGERYYRNASVAYARWGGRRKARQLATRVPEPRHRAQALTVELPAVSWPVEPRTDNFDAIALARATQALSSEMVPSKLMARLMAIAIEQAGAERGFLLLFRDGELWVEGAAGSDADSFTRFRLPAPDVTADSTPAGRARGCDQTAFPLPRTVIDFVLAAREKVVLTQTTTPNRFAADPYVVQHRPRSLLCLPMLRQGNLTGLLYLENRLTTDVFATEQIELLEMLSTQAAISLENARLYEELEERVKDRTHRLEQSLRTIQENQAKLIEAERRAAVAHLESELAIARRIQTSILPRQLSVSGMEIAAVMRTATEVGGDYYDILPSDDGGCWVGIGDVSGHGLDAGLVMLMVQSGLAALMRGDARIDPASLLCIVNRAIYDNVRCRLQRDDYVTLSLLRFFPDGRFRVAGAHEDIVIWRAQSGRCESMVTSGTWVGIVKDIESATRSQDGYLSDGDVMVLFTDGIIEARRDDDEQLGIAPFLDIVSQAHAEPAAELCRRIVERAQAWSTEQQDDQTVVVLRRGARR